MGMERLNVGLRGERIAAAYLRKKGYRIRHTNYRTPFGEIDIVANDKDAIVFVEVRTRTSPALGPPLLSITRLKQLRMARNALFFLKRYGLADNDWRLDVLSIKLDEWSGSEEIEHIENAVEDII